LGDIVRRPILTTFAENGPEAAIPINSSARSRGLWVETGRLLGIMDPNSAGSEIEIKVDYSPVINLSGNAPDNLEEILRRNNENLVRQLNEQLREQKNNERRTVYA
jgi:hypothetical protein